MFAAAEFNASHNRFSKPPLPADGAGDGLCVKDPMASKKKFKIFLRRSTLESARRFRYAQLPCDLRHLAVAELEPQIPADTPDDYVGVKRRRLNSGLRTGWRHIRLLSLQGCYVNAAEPHRFKTDERQ